jgi:hypothetical protein
MHTTSRKLICRASRLSGFRESAILVALSMAWLGDVPDVLARGSVDDATTAAQTAATQTTQAAAQSTAGAQPTAATAQAAEPTLDEILTKALNAYGGKTALQKVEKNSIVYGEQTLSADAGHPLSYRNCRRSIRWRIDLDSTIPAKGAANPDEKQSPGTSRQTILAFDGIAGWQSNGRAISDLSTEEVERLSDQELKQPFLLAHWHQQDYDFKLRGRTQYKQAPVFAIDVTMPAETSVTTLYLDQNNYLVVAISYEEKPSSSIQKDGDQKTSNVVVEYSEYRPIGGTLWPCKQARYVDGETIAETTLSNVDLSADLPDSQFNRPDSGNAVRLSKEVVVPFDYSQREIIVKGHLNDSEEAEFLFDTGASDTLIDRRVAAEHFLPKQGEFDIQAISGVISTHTSTVKRLELGHLIVNDIPVRLIDLSPQSKHLGRPIAGIIGTNVISKYLVTLDYSKPSITFADLETAARPQNAVPLPFAVQQAPFISARLNGKEAQMLLADTGAAFNHLPFSVARHYTSNDPSAIKHFTEGTGLDGQPIRLGTVTLDNVTVSGFAVHKVTFTYPYKDPNSVESAPNGKGKGISRGGFFQDAASGILGNPFWNNFIVTIDWKYQRLMLQNNPSFKVRDEIERSLSAGDNALILKRDYRTAELSYQKAMIAADNSGDPKEQAKILGRLGNLRRIMAKDLNRPEHAKAAYDYFSKAVEKAQQSKASDVQGRVLADWSLLYSDNGQTREAKTTIDRALLMAPDDPNVNVDCAVQLYRSHMFPEMQKYIEKALFLDPDNWQALWYQVKLSESFGDTTKTTATLKEIIRYYPWSNLAKDKLKALTLPATPPPAQTQGQPGSPVHQ